MFTITDLAHRDGVHYATASRHVKKLLERGELTHSRVIGLNVYFEKWQLSREITSALRLAPVLREAVAAVEGEVERWADGDNDELRAFGLHHLYGVAYRYRRWAPVIMTAALPSSQVLRQYLTAREIYCQAMIGTVLPAWCLRDTDIHDLLLVQLDLMDKLSYGRDSQDMYQEEFAFLEDNVKVLNEEERSRVPSISKFGAVRHYRVFWQPEPMEASDEVLPF